MLIGETDKHLSGWISDKGEDSPFSWGQGTGDGKIREAFYEKAVFILVSPGPRVVLGEWCLE